MISSLLNSIQARFVPANSGDITMLDRMRFSTKTRLKLYEKMSTFLKNGVSLDSVFVKLEEVYTRYSPNSIRVKVLRDLHHGLSQGENFSQSVSRWAPYSEVMMVSIGEASKDANGLPNAMERAVKSVRDKQDLSSAMAKEMAYPFALFVILLVVLHSAGSNLFARFAEFSDPSEWTDSAYTLYAISTFIANYDFVLLFAAAAVAAACILSLPKYTGDFRQYLDRLPPWNIYKRLESANFLIAASALMKSGMPLVETIDFIAKNASSYTRGFLDITRQRIEMGDIQGGTALSTGFFDKETSIDIDVYSNTSELADTINIIGEATVKNTIASISVSSRILGTSLLILVGFVIYNLFMALMDISGGSSAGMM